jgi:hypothetical protein
LTPAFRYLIGWGPAWPDWSRRERSSTLVHVIYTIETTTTTILLLLL